MPMVEVKWYKGHELEDKRKVAQGIEKLMQEIGLPPGVTHVVFHDIPKEDWMVPGRDS